MTTEERIEELENQINQLIDELQEKEDYDYLKETNEKQEEEIEKLNNRIDELEDKLSKIKELKTKISNLEYDNKLLNNDIKDLENELDKKDSEIDFKNRRIIELEEKLAQYENNNEIKEKDEIIEKLKQEIILKDKTIENLSKNNISNDSKNESKGSKTSGQSEQIKLLQDTIIKKNEQIRKLECPPDRTITIGKNKIYKCKEEIKDYEKRYNELFEKIAKPRPESEKTFRLRIRNYKRNTNGNMKYLEELDIKPIGTKTPKYDMSKVQYDALIEKIVLFQCNGWGGLLY